MTRQEQKQEEFALINYAFSNFGEMVSLEPGADPPDAVAMIGGRKIGIEVRLYFQEGRYDGFTRKQIEEYWGELRNRASEIVEQEFPDISGVATCLYFREWKLPAKRERDHFIREVAVLIRQNLRTLSGGIVELQTWNSTPLLAKYLKFIDAYAADAKLQWDSNLTAGRYGASEDELCNIVRQKSKSRYNGLEDEYWLMIFGGRSISSLIGIISVEQLKSYQGLLELLDSAPFSQVHIIDLGDCFVWKRGCGWSERCEAVVRREV